MKVRQLHSWQVNTAEARQIQLGLAEKVSRKNEVARPAFIAGVDISVDKIKGLARGAVVVLSYPEMKLVEVEVAAGWPEFPYVPGLLTFREAPLILQACSRLDIEPDLFIVDGQGLAHPRRIGIACHLGLCLDKPTIGCAKSRLCGEHGEPGLKAGRYARLVYEGEVVGAVLRTKDGVSPVYVSIGHKVDLAAARKWVLACCRGYRLPEPVRYAHMAAGGIVLRK